MRHGAHGGFAFLRGGFFMDIFFPSRFARYRPGPEGGHGRYDQVAEEVSDSLYKDKITSQLMAQGYEGADLERSVLERITPVLERRHRMNMRTFGAEVDRIDDQTAVWEIRSDGEFYNSQYDTTMSEMFENTRFYYRNIGREFNESEASAVTDIARRLSAGEASAGIYLTSDVRGTVRYATQLSMDDGKITSTYIDVGKAAGRDLSWSEGQNIMRNLEIRHSLSQQRVENDASYPYFLADAKISTTDVKVTARSVVHTNQIQYETVWKQPTSPTESADAVTPGWMADAANRVMDDAGRVAHRLVEESHQSMMAVGLVLAAEYQRHKANKQAESQIAHQQEKITRREQVNAAGDLPDKPKRVTPTTVVFEKMKTVRRKIREASAKIKAGLLPLPTSGTEMLANTIRIGALGPEKKRQKRKKHTGKTKRIAERMPTVVPQSEGMNKERKRTKKRRTQLSEAMLERAKERKQQRRKRTKEAKIAPVTPEVRTVRKKERKKEKRDRTQAIRLFRLSRLLMASLHRSESRGKPMGNGKEKASVKRLHREARNGAEKKQRVEKLRDQVQTVLLLLVWHQILRFALPDAPAGSAVEKKPFAKPETGEFSFYLLAAIIWYLAMIREQSATTPQPKKKTGKKKNPLRSRRLQRYGIIFSFHTEQPVIVLK
jgi:hypothetical protein